MDRQVFPVLMLSLLLPMCLVCACVSPFFPEDRASSLNKSPVIDVGLVPVNQTPAPEFISFTELREGLGQNELRPFHQYPNKTKILFIQGRSLDNAGNAGQWILGVENGDVTDLLVYDSSGWTTISWNRIIVADEIDLEQVIPPDILFDQYGGRITELSLNATSGQRDIELKNGVYQMTISSGNTSRILKFNATTGVAIE